MKGNKFRTELAKICPDYQLDTDEDGQVIIYTNLQEDAKGNYVDFVYPDDEEVSA